jgi:XTP/dITP diphosphohydrolase
VTLPARWVLATGNAGKVAELEALFATAGLRMQLTTQTALGVRPIAETAPTFVENALRKARHAARATGLPAIADDSGLVVGALGGAPGVRSARYAGRRPTDAANVAKLLAALAPYGPGQREARFHCVLVALRSPADPAPLIAGGEWLGEVALSPAGTAGFGYDPVFLDPSLGRTAAELTREEKNGVSHRGAALRQLAGLLTKY